MDWAKLENGDLWCEKEGRDYWITCEKGLYTLKAEHWRLVNSDNRDEPIGQSTDLNELKQIAEKHCE